MASAPHGAWADSVFSWADHVAGKWGRDTERYPDASTGDYLKVASDPNIPLTTTPRFNE